MSLSEEKIKFLKQKAQDIRISIIEMLVEAGSGHTAGPLGMSDIFSYLYGSFLKYKPEDTNWPHRDRLLLSNGHIAPVLYSTMAHYGFFPIEELKTLRKFGSRLQGHPHREYLDGLETSSGPLGCGLSQAIGMALADRIDNGPSSDKQFVCLMGDGELQEGNVWEAMMLAGKEKIQNLTVVIDRNNIQIDGYTENVMPLEPLSDKWEAFNFHVTECDGHNFLDIDRVFGQARSAYDKPSVIIAYTIPGKGVSEFERKPEWHGKPPKGNEAKMAIESIRSLGGKIETENN